MTPEPSNYAVWPCTVPANATLITPAKRRKRL